MRWLTWLIVFVAAGPAYAAELAIKSETGRSVFRRGEGFDVDVRFAAPADVARASLELWLVESTRRVRIGSDDFGPLAAATHGFDYRLDTDEVAPGSYQLVARLILDGQHEETAVPFEVVTAERATRFRNVHMGLPGWVLPTGNLAADSRRYGFNFLLSNLADNWHRGAAGVELTGPEQQAQEMLRHGIDFIKFPTVFGWGLAHRPIRTGASWFDPSVIEMSAQLTQYHAQAGRRFPNFRGLNTMDEPGVSWSDDFMAAAYKAQTGRDVPPEDGWKTDPENFRAYQVFRNHVIAGFHERMKPYMTEIVPDAVFTCETFADILTRSGLYPSGNTFMDEQWTHMYDHWPASNNWIAFDCELRRANRKAFWHKPLIVFTGCYGIQPDQWRASWSLAMSARIEGHGYFLGAGELPEDQPWAEYSLAEMTRINRVNEQFGDFFLSLEKPVEPLALWYSLDQAATHPADHGYEYDVMGAFFALKRTHFPVTVITDEDVRNGLLGEHKVLLLVGVTDVRDDLKEHVAKFAAGGGKLVADRTTTLFRDKAVAMDADFRGYAAANREINNAWNEGRQPVSMQLRRDLFAEPSVVRQLQAVERTLGPLVDRPVTARNIDTFISVMNHGDDRVIFVANDRSVAVHPTEGARWITMQESMPATDRLSMPWAKGRAIRDLFTGEALTLEKDGGLPLELPAAGLRVVVVDSPRDKRIPFFGVDAPVEKPHLPGGPVAWRLTTVNVMDAKQQALFKGRKAIVVVASAGREALAQRVAEQLGATVKLVEDVRKPDVYSDTLDPEKNKGVWMMPRWQPLALSVGADLVLIGTPEDNELVKDINQSGTLPRVIHPTTLGPGQGLVQYAWSPFDTDRDAVVISAYDDAGYESAIKAFERGEPFDARAQPLPADLSVQPRPDGSPGLDTPNLTPVWKAQVSDGVQQLSVRGGRIAVGGWDNRLTVLDADGNLVWRRPFDYRVLGVAVSDDGQRIAAAAFPVTTTFDEKGSELFTSSVLVPSQDDVEAIAVRNQAPDGQAVTVKGTWQGQVMAYAADSKRLWIYPAPPEVKKEGDATPVAEPPKSIGAVRSIAFLPDGHIAVAGMKALLVLDATGKEVRRQDFDRLQDIAATADGRVVAGSFKKKVTLLDAAGQTLWSKETPDFVMAVDVSPDGSLIAAGLFGGQVLFFDAQGNPRAHARLPWPGTLTGLQLDAPAGAIYAATWEGQVARFIIPALNDAPK